MKVKLSCWWTSASKLCFRTKNRYIPCPSTQKVLITPNKKLQMNICKTIKINKAELGMNIFRWTSTLLDAKMHSVSKENKIHKALGLCTPLLSIAILQFPSSLSPPYHPLYFRAEQEIAFKSESLHVKLNSRFCNCQYYFWSILCYQVRIIILNLIHYVIKHLLFFSWRPIILTYWDFCYHVTMWIVTLAIINEFESLVFKWYLSLVYKLCAQLFKVTHLFFWC